MLARLLVATLVFGSIACAHSPTSPGVTFREIGSGFFSSFDTAQVVLARDAAAWETTRASLSFSTAPLSIDFATEVAAIVALGQRPTGGYAVRVTGVPRSDGGVEIQATEEAPGPSCITPQVITFPFAVVALPRSVASVTVVWSRTIRTC